MKTLQLESHHEKWNEEFVLLKNIFYRQLSQLIIDIQHVGSTSIPNVMAKPIIDIDIIIENKHHLEEIIKVLEKLGYHYKGEQNVAGRHVFRQKHPYIPWSLKFKKRTKQHVYVCFSESLALKNHICFKKALLENERLRHNYNHLKHQLVYEKCLSKEEYAHKKTDFVLNVLSENGFTPQEIDEIKSANS